MIQLQKKTNLKFKYQHPWEILSAISPRMTCVAASFVQRNSTLSTKRSLINNQLNGIASHSCQFNIEFRSQKSVRSLVYLPIRSFICVHSRWWSSWCQKFSAIFIVFFNSKLSNRFPDKNTIFVSMYTCVVDTVPPSIKTYISLLRAYTF